MVPLEAWHDTESTITTTRTVNRPFGGGEWNNEPLGQMDFVYGHSPWLPTSDGRKRFHREVIPKNSLPGTELTTITPSQELSELEGETPLQDPLSPSLIEAGWNDQMLGNVMLLEAESQPFETTNPDGTNEVQSSHDTQAAQAIATVHGQQRVYRHEDMQRMVPDSCHMLGISDCNAGGNMDQYKNRNEVSTGDTVLDGFEPINTMAAKIFRDQENSFGSETSNFSGRLQWPSTISNPPSVAGNCSLSGTTTCSVSALVKSEVTIEHISVAESPIFTLHKSGHLEAFSEVPSSLSNQHMQHADSDHFMGQFQQQFSGLQRRNEAFDTKSSNISCIETVENTILSSCYLPETRLINTQTENVLLQHQAVPHDLPKSLNEYNQRNTQTYASPRAAEVSSLQRGSGQLSSQLLATPLPAIPAPNPVNSLGGQTQTSQIPLLAPQFDFEFSADKLAAAHPTPSLQHSPPPGQQTVGLQESFSTFVKDPNQNGLLSTRLLCEKETNIPCHTAIETMEQRRGEQLESMKLQKQHYMREVLEQQQLMLSNVNGYQHSALIEQQQLTSQGLPMNHTTMVNGLAASGYPQGELNVMEAAVLHQLQTTMSQLEVGTRMCIRDALYRLARSAKERRGFGVDSTSSSQNSAELDNATMDSCVTGDGLRRESRGKTETQTNPIDRFIAHLLFHGVPSRQIGQSTLLKHRTMSPTISGAQNGQWVWPSTVLNWIPASGGLSESHGVAKVAASNPLISNWAALPLMSSHRAPVGTSCPLVDSRMDTDNSILSGGRDNMGSSPGFTSSQFPDVQSDRQNTFPPSSMPTGSLSSGNEVFDFGRFSDSSQCSMLPPCVVEEAKLMDQTHSDLDGAAQTFADRPRYSSIRYNPGTVNYREIGSNGISQAAQNSEIRSLGIHDSYHRAGNLTTGYQETQRSQFPHQDVVGGMAPLHYFDQGVDTVRGDINRVTHPYSFGLDIRR